MSARAASARTRAVDEDVVSPTAAQVCVIRAAAGMAVAAALPLLDLTAPERTRIAVLVALAWIPWTAVSLVVRSRFVGRVSAVVLAAGDLTLLGMLWLRYPALGSLLVLCGAGTVALLSFRAGWRLGLLTGLAGMGAYGIPGWTAGGPEVEPGPVLACGLLLACSLGGDALGVARRRLHGELQLSEERTGAVLARVADAVVVTDGRGLVRQWNASAESQLGHEADAAIGRHCDELLGLHQGARRLDCSEGCALVALRAAAQEGAEVWRQLPDGRRQPLLASVTAVIRPDDTLDEVVHSLRDITRLKEAEEAKTLFLATASHELKTPLTVIRGYAQTLVVNPGMSADDRQQALTTVLRRSEELGKIVDRLLLSSRIDAGHVHVARQPVDVTEIVAERAASLGAATGAPISTRFDDGVPPALGDPDAVTTVIDHLLENAVKYSPDRTPIEIAVRTGRRGVVIEVRDRGVGMDESQMAHCFDRFWQGERSEGRRFGGTGIGLYIVRSLVDAMAGDVSVESRLGSGSTFTVLLARADLPQPRTPADAGEASIIREFMRQIGVPSG